MTLPDGKMVHAILEAHLDEKEGNELDVVFENHDKKEGYPIPMNAKVTARVTRAGIDKEENLEFKPADKDERKGDPDGKCSRFAAEAKWMKPDDKLTVVLSVEYDGKLKKTTYHRFRSQGCGTQARPQVSPGRCRIIQPRVRRCAARG